MVYFKKSQPAPKSLEEEKIKTNGDYKKKDVIDQLNKDFCGKCYICEQKITSANIDHFTPHRGNVDLKFDWNNLFLACYHCNNIKSAKYDNILNCTNKNDNVDTKIAYRFNPFPKEKPSFEALCDDKRTLDTAELLDKVFNGQNSVKNIDSINLNDALLKEILEFQNVLCGYFKNNDKKHFLIEIKTHLNKSSPFTAFKRYIVRKNEDLKREFEQYIID